NVKGWVAAGWLSSRLGAADGPGRRRWIRLTFAGRDRMTGNRRELPRSSVAGRRRRPVPHRGVEGRPCGRARPDAPAASVRRSALGAERLVGCDRPDEAGELAGAGDDDLLAGLAARGHPLPAAVEALLAAPGVGAGERVLLVLAAGEPLADLG